MCAGSTYSSRERRPEVEKTMGIWRRKIMKIVFASFVVITGLVFSVAAALADEDAKG